MPEGKPAGVKCKHLTSDYRCALWGKPERPDVCNAFRAEPDFCGSDRNEAMSILTSLL
jgi:hypothetical protein